jgi:hypothetical protein
LVGLSGIHTTTLVCGSAKIHPTEEGAKCGRKGDDPKSLKSAT